MGQPSSIFLGKTRTVGEIELTEPGTYRIQTDSPAQYVAEIEVNGKRMWVSKSKNQLSDTKIIQVATSMVSDHHFRDSEGIHTRCSGGYRCTFRDRAGNTSKQDLCPKTICSSHSVKRSISSEPTGPGLFGDGQRT